MSLQIKENQQHYYNSTTENLVYGMLHKNDSSRTTEDKDKGYEPAAEFHNQKTTKSDNSDIYMNIC